MKKIALSALLILTIVIAGFFSYKSATKSRGIIQVESWRTTDENFDIVSGNGKLITLENATGGIVPLNYQEKNRDFVLSIFDIRSNSEVEKTLFFDIPERTSIKLIQNTVDPEKIWIMSFHSVNDCQSNNCNFHLFEFDLRSGVSTAKSDINFSLTGSPEAQLHSLVPLTHDPVQNQVWFAFNVIDPKYEYKHFDTEKQKNITEKKNSYITNVIAYNANSNHVLFNESLIRGVDFGGKRHTFDVDQNGDMYVDTECIFNDCPVVVDSSYSSEDQFYRIAPSEHRYYARVIEPIFTYDMKSFAREFSIDQQNSSMYIVNMTWNAAPASTIVHYDTNRKISTQIGIPPIKYEEDVRGFLATENKLLIGTFSGLGIYDKISDSWKMITTENGIKDNNIEHIFKLENGICISHEGKGSSCYFGPLDTL